jgi:hypothetical protein
MWIRTRPSSVSMFLEARRPTEDWPIPVREMISFGLLPTDDGDHLDLDTGEVFQDYGYARLHKKEQKLIGASATIQLMSDDSSYKQNAMRYRKERNSDDGPEPSSIHFQVFVSPAAYRELAENIRSGLFPKTIQFGLADDPDRFFTTPGSPKKRTMEFGWEPDGSGMIWHNTDKENQRIAIEDVRFEYAVSKPRYDDSQSYRPLPMQFGSINEQGNAQIALVQTSLTDISKLLRRATAAVVTIAVLVVILIIKQGLL